MKRILFITNEFPPITAGIANFSFNLSEQLCISGHDIFVLVYQGDMSIKDGIGADSKLRFKVFRVSWVLGNLGTYFSRLFYAIKLLLIYAPDILIITNRQALFLFPFLKLLFFKRSIVVIHGNELLLKNKLVRKWIRYSISLADEIIAVSNYTRLLIDDSTLYNRCKVINNGVSEELLRIGANDNKQYSSENCLVFSTVGTVRPRKGHLQVLRHLVNIRDRFPNFKYIICGKLQFANYYKELIKFITDHKLSENVTFISDIEYDNIQGLANVYSQTSIYLLLSEEQTDGDTEGFGISVLEANAFGVPAIVSNRCGTADAVKQGYNGMQIYTHDEKDFENSLNKILSDYKSFSNNARYWAEEHAWHNVARMYPVE